MTNGVVGLRVDLLAETGVDGGGLGWPCTELRFATANMWASVRRLQRQHGLDQHRGHPWLCSLMG